MKTKHTSGKWMIDFPTLTEMTICTEEMNICTVLCIDISEEEAEANAKLIAAAPDLLKSLNDLIAKTSPIIYKMGVKKGFDELLALEDAKKAIKKATE